MSKWFVILASLGYLLLLFAVAYFAEHKQKAGKSIVANPYVYALSLAVYCTAWTFYGSVGRTISNGLDFLYIYIGPTIMAPLFMVVLRKIIRISKTYRITSIADFISTRFGKNISLGIIVTVLCVVGIIPYISIQLKAINISLELLSAGNQADVLQPENWWADSTLYIAIGLSIFVILFGTRSVDATEKHEGLVAAVAFESIVKLAAFLAVGVFVTYGLFDGYSSIFQQAKDVPELKKIFTLEGEGSYMQITSVLLLSMSAILFLPRQFQVAVVENTHEKHLKKASWLFPLYLFLINFFVVAIALGGYLLLTDVSSPDTYVISLPLYANQPWLALLVYIGGFSAASSMIIVEIIALSTMISNHIVLPAFLSIEKVQENIDKSIRVFIQNSRRISIVFIMLLALLFDKLVAEKYSLVSIGLVSFTAVAQFAPAMLAGLYWKMVSKNAAVTSIIIGFVIWFYTLVVPSMVGVEMIDQQIMTDGLFGLTILRPQALFGLEGWDIIAHGFFWSIFFNSFSLFLVSFIYPPQSRELYQAELFVDIDRMEIRGEEVSVIWKETAQVEALQQLVATFIGAERTASMFESYATRRNLSLSGKADPALVGLTERLLAGAIGSAAARIMVRSVAKEKEPSIEEVLRVLQESQQIKEMNKELRKKSLELTKATEQLTKANQQLKQLDELKDEFLYTVTHELRTPLTSIRALSEIVFDNPDLPEEDRLRYLEAVIRETERLSHLITQVLSLEKYENGMQHLEARPVDLAQLLHDNLASIQALISKEQLEVKVHIASLLPTIHADPDLLSQVFYNLISNAIKHAKATIHVSAQFSDGQFCIEVTDDGKGIPLDIQELIFDKFFQAKNQTLQKPQGSGLGLAICKKIIELHHGQINVQSAPNEGATFRVILPMRINEIV